MLRGQGLVATTIRSHGRQTDPADGRAGGGLIRGAGNHDVLDETVWAAADGVLFLKGYFPSWTAEAGRFQQLAIALVAYGGR